MATGKIANLSVGVSLDAAEFTNGLSKTEAQAKKWGDAMTARSAAIGGALGAALGGRLDRIIDEAVNALPRMFTAAADAMDAFNDLKDATGASIENISALDDVARRTGTTFESVQGTLVKFNKVLGEARDNNGAGDALKALGLNAEELKRIDPAEALRQTAVALAQFADDGNKARIIQELFGKSVKEAAPFLKDLAEQGSLVAKTTTEQAQAAEDYNKAIFAFQAAATSFQRSVTSAILPSLNEAIAKFKDAQDSYGNMWDAIRDAGGTRNDPFKNTTERISVTRAELAKLNEEIEQRSASTSPIGNALNKGRIKDINDEIALLKKREDFLLKVQAREATQASYSNEGAKSTAGTSLNSLPDLKDMEDSRKAREKAEKESAAAYDRRQKAEEAALKSAQEGSRRYIDNLQKQVEKTRELSNVEQVIADIEAGRFEAQNAAEAGRAIAYAADLDQTKRITDQLKAQDEQQKLLDDNRKANLGEVAKLLESVRTPQEQYNAEVERYAFLRREAGLSEEAYSRAVAQSAERMKDAQEKANTANKAMTEFAKQAERNIQDALGQTIEDSLSGNFESIGQMWIKLIQKMAAQAIAARLNDALFGGSGSNSGALLKGIVGLFGAASGAGSAGNAGYGDYKAYFDSIATSHATGTNYIPYDNYPALLHKGEAVVPAKYNPANGGMGAGASFDFSGQTINVGEGVSRGEVMAAVEAGNARTIAKINRTLQQQRGT